MSGPQHYSIVHLQLPTPSLHQQRQAYRIPGKFGSLRYNRRIVYILSLHLSVRVKREVTGSEPTLAQKALFLCKTEV